MSIYLLATILFSLIFLASIVSIEVGLAAAVIEVIFGVVAGNLFHIHPTTWVDFLATFGSANLVFLAGTEVDVSLMKRHWQEAALIGGASFALPLTAGFLYAYYVAHWTAVAAMLGGIALSGTSLAIVYAVLVEMGLSVTSLGKRIMAAAFVTDILTVVALTLLFLHGNLYSLWFIGGSVLLMISLPKFFRNFLERYDNRVIQPEIKLLFVALFFIEWLGIASNNQPILPLFILGLLMSGTFAKNPELIKKMRLVAFAVVTPFFFLKSGMSVELKYVISGAGVMIAFLGLKLLAKFIAVFPLARRYHGEHRTFTTLLMSTDLTFGSIASLYGLEHRIITERQFSLLITAVILSAVLPTIIALRFFMPNAKAVQDMTLAIGDES